LLICPVIVGIVGWLVLVISLEYDHYSSSRIPMHVGGNGASDGFMPMHVIGIGMAGLGRIIPIIAVANSCLRVIAVGLSQR
jgi:hypothetical protein